MKQHAPFVHLHVHTTYSFLDGAIRIPDLVEQAVRLRFPALAITDHGGMFGVIEFYQKALASGVKPIIGSEFYVAPGGRGDRGSENGDPYHLVLLARDLAGYKNLLALSSASYLEGFYRKPRIDREILARHSGGLIALSACLKGEPARKLLAGDAAGAREAASWYRDLLGDAYYLELQVNGLAEQEKANALLSSLGRELGIPLVATNDVHYLRREDQRLQDVLLCIQTGKTVHDANRLRMESEDLYLKSAEEMQMAFRAYPETAGRTLEVAERCNLEIPLGRSMLPEYPLPPGATADAYLEEKAREGFERRMENLLARVPEKDRARTRERYAVRLEHELAMISSMGFPGYFLIVWDFIHYARSRGYPVGPGRGSAAGSLTAYSLGITDIDPIRYGLFFERFLNPERISPPDIDVDFCMECRDEVIRYVAEKYGQDHVAQIITFGTMAARGAIRDVGRALEMNYVEVDRIAKLVPEVPDITLKKALEQEPRLKELAKRDAKVGELLELAQKVEGLNRHASVHAAGVVISKDPLVDHVPLYLGKNDEVVTQFSMEDLEKAGLLKFDFLGLRTLTLLNSAVRQVNARRSGEGKAPLTLSEIDLSDPETYQLLGRGDTDGVFQLESSGMKDLLVRMKPGTFEDLIALVALYRPGPLGSGMVTDFVSRKQGKQPIHYELPQLERILRETYGVIVYQEQVMQIASELAGYTLGEADILRRAMGKKKAEEMESQRARFLEGCRKKRIPEAKAARIFEMMEFFAGYGFNKSHSAAYALISFQTAYLKAHHPEEFMAALLTSEMDNSDKVTQHIAVCRDMGIRILPPDINESVSDFTVVREGIRFGLGAVKNVGDAALESILRERDRSGPFRTLSDFCRRVDMRAVNRRVVESLIKSGAFDGLGGHRAQLLAALDAAMETGQKEQRDRENGQISIFGVGGGESLPDQPLPAVEPWGDAQKLAFEKESLGFYITGHPLERYRKELERYVTSDLGRLFELPDNSPVRVAGMVQGVKEKTTKTGDRMAFITLEDLHGNVELVVFPDLYREAAAKVSSDMPLVVEGTLDAAGEKPKVKVQRIESLAEFRRKMTRNVILHVNAVAFGQEELSTLKKILTRHKGTSGVRIRLTVPAKSDVIILAGKDLAVDSSEEMISEVEKMLGAGTVTFE